MAKPSALSDAHPVIRWLMTDARRRVDADDFLEAFANELRAAGVDVSRITTRVPILHSQIFSFSGLCQENRRREENDAPRIDYGIALHVGDVIYSNIGSDTRLDFTVIGPAVNLTARIESMCKQLQRSLLLSSDFATTSGVVVESLGAFALKGVGAEQEIFAPRP